MWLMLFWENVVVRQRYPLSMSTWWSEYDYQLDEGGKVGFASGHQHSGQSVPKDVCWWDFSRISWYFVRFSNPRLVRRLGIL